MQQYDLIIVGSGASGLLAGIGALKNGISKVIILEQEDTLGGNLNLFINDGFGEFYLEKKVTGPEFASILIEEFIALGGTYKINTRVLNINKDKEVNYLNPIDGLDSMKANSIVLASGCREKYTGNIIVPIHKYTGIFTVASAHKLVNFDGYLPGKKIIITGSNIWTFILARRLVIEGANVKAIISEKDKLDDKLLGIISGFKIPVIYNSEVAEVGGSERIEWAKIDNTVSGESEIIYCNSLVLSIGYYPELDYLKELNLKMDGVYPYQSNYETSVENIFCCGTILSGISGIIESGEEGIKVGKIVADKLKKY